MVDIYNEDATGDKIRNTSLVMMLKKNLNKWEILCKIIYTKQLVNICIWVGWDFSQNPRELVEKQWVIFTVIFTEVVLGNTEVLDLDGIKITKYIHATQI